MTKGMVDIIECKDGNNPFCRDTEILVNHCYDYYKEYCPKTCAYAKQMDSPKTRIARGGQDG